jgi:hypothetical protein
MLTIKPTKDTSIQNYGEDEDGGIYVFSITGNSSEAFGPFFYIEFNNKLELECWEVGEEETLSKRPR